jgi:hypothetical protein
MSAVAARLAPYFDSALEQFASAVRSAARGPDRCLRIAERPLQLLFAGPALGRRILPALAHLPEDTAAPTFTIHLWDSASTGTMLPPPPWDGLAYHERGNTRAFDDERFSLNFDRPTDVFIAVDRERRVAIYWTRDAARIPNFDTAAPLRRLLQAWLRDAGCYVVHAAAIGTRDRGLLLAGRGGSGKSTTAVRALDFALQYAGDDFCLVQREPAPYVHSLYNAAKLNADALARMPALAPAVVNRDRLDREKALIFLHECRPERVTTGFPLHAIVLPHVTGRADTAISAASPLAAYRAIGPDTALRTLGDARGLLAMLKALVHEIPCYDLALGTDEDGIRRALDDVIARG